MNLTITPTLLRGDITPPPSKSQAHRLMLCAALARGESVIENVAASQDIQATLRCMEALGASWTAEGSALRIKGVGGSALPASAGGAPPHFDCGESGSTLRFLIPIALALRGGGVFTGRGRLMERPQKPYFDLFDGKGVAYERQNGALTLRGTLSPGQYCLPGNVSSQFFTGLLYALPLLDGDSSVVSTTPLESAGYIDMTRQAMERFGVVSRQEGLVFQIPGGQAFQAADAAVEADWSQAAFWYAAKALGNPVTVRGMNSQSAQGDRVVGCFCRRLTQSGDLELDVSQCPDLVPPLALMAAVRPGTTRLINAGRLRIKESDRLATVTSALTALGGEVAEGPDSLTILGKDVLPGGVTIDCCNDHRIAMMAAVAAARCREPVTLIGAQCVAKSYPNFWEDYRLLGGIIHEHSGE